jgi:hypothetical protein
MSAITVVITLNELGERIRAQVYRDTPPGDSDGRLDLIIPIVDSQTNEVRFVKKDKFTLGKDCALPGDDTSFLGKAEREAFDRSPSNVEVTQGQSGNDVPAEPAPAPTSGKKNKHKG